MPEESPSPSQETPAAVPPLVPHVPSPDEPPPAPTPPTEVIAPTRVWLRSAREARSGGPGLVMAALTTDALWIHDTGRLRHIPLATLAGVESRQSGKALDLVFRPWLAAEGLTLTFGSIAK